jgi:hypothetical protein
LGGEVAIEALSTVDDNAADQASRRTAYYVTRPALGLPVEPQVQVVERVTRELRGKGWIRGVKILRDLGQYLPLP